VGWADWRAEADGGAGVGGAGTVVVGGAVGEALVVAPAVDDGGLLVAGGFVVTMRVGAGRGTGIWAGSSGGAATIGAPVCEVGGRVVGVAAVAAEVGAPVGASASSGYSRDDGATGPTARLTSTRDVKTRQPSPNA
jgi:hypothetical protein